MNGLEIAQRRKFWRRVLFAGILIIVIALLVMVKIYLSGMAEVGVIEEAESAEGDLEIAKDIAILSARRDLLMNACIWTLPFAIVASVVMQVAKYKLKRLKKLEKIEKFRNLGDSTH